MSKNKLIGHIAIGLGKAAIRAGELAVGERINKISVEMPVDVNPAYVSPARETSREASKRAYKREAEWGAMKYRQFNFKIDRGQAERFTSALEANGEKAVDWFRDRIEEYLNGLD